MSSSRTCRVTLVSLLATSIAVPVGPLAAQASEEPSATLVNTVWTGGTNSSWLEQSSDPAGITYNSRTGQLIISDSEVDEQPMYSKKNLFVSSLQGHPITEANGSTLAYSKEPTGVGFRPGVNGWPERLYVSDDDQDKIFEVTANNGVYGDADDTFTSFSTKFIGSKDDAEDVAVDLQATRNGQLLIIDGYHKQVYLYGPGQNGEFDALPSAGGDDTLSQFDVYVHGASDPEGIAYNRSRDTIFVLDDPSVKLYEFSLDGSVRNKISIKEAKIPSQGNPKSAAGIAFAPPSDGSGGPDNIYIVDRGVDNDSNPDTSNDGRFYEMQLPPLGDGATTNVAPSVDAGSDLSVVLPNAASLDGTSSDDGLPNGTLTYTWSKSSGPGTVSFGDPSAQDTTATFSDKGTYVLRLTVDDGELSAYDEVTVTVSDSSTGGSGTSGVLEVPVRASTDDAEERSSGTKLGSGDLNMTQDGSTAQIVGMRFTGLAIPNGATITKAYVQFQVDEASTGIASLGVSGQANDDAGAFTTATGDISSRPRTAESVAWNPAEWPTTGARGADQQTSDLSPVVQEIVNQSGWVSGNALVLIVTGTGERTAESYDGGSAKAPVLHVEYTS